MTKFRLALQFMFAALLASQLPFSKLLGYYSQQFDG
jgi:hypothetical protein